MLLLGKEAGAVKQDLGGVCFQPPHVSATWGLSCSLSALVNDAYSTASPS